MLLKVLLFLAAAALPAYGQLSPGDYNFEITFDGRQRDFIVHVPPGAPSSGAPLFFNFHGFGNSAQPFSENTGMKLIGEREGFIGVVPQGWQSSWNGGSCCGSAARLGLDDVGLTRAMLDFVAERIPVDRRRVFAAGFSNGGFLSYRLACEGSDFITAVGPVAAQLSGESNFPCNPSAPVPLFHTHGTNDSSISFSGGSSSVARYEEIAQCSGARTATFQNGTATCETATGCANGGEVTFCTVAGQAHDWPGCYPNNFNYCPDSSTQDIKTTEEMWNFFSRF